MLLDLAPEPYLTTSDPRALLFFLPIGYLCTVLIEAPILVFGLSKTLSFRQRLFAGFWLTACTYPIVVLVLPMLFSGSTRFLYLLVAEIFAPFAECVLFWFVFRGVLENNLKTKLRNFGVITLANLLSFGVGEILNSIGWFGLF